MSRDAPTRQTRFVLVLQHKVLANRICGVWLLFVFVFESVVNELVYILVPLHQIDIAFPCYFQNGP